MTEHTSATEPHYGLGDTSYRAAGEETGIRRLVDAFYRIMEELPEARGIRAMHPADLGESRDKLGRFLCGWLNGPKLYWQKYGPIKIPNAHAHLRVGAEERDAWLHCMEQAIAEQDYAPEFGAYLLRELGRPAQRIVEVSASSVARAIALLILLALLPAPSPSLADEVDTSYEQSFDPWEGMEKDGRIPKVELPEDLPNPERWRYIPPARIKPGNFFDRFLVSSFIAPVLFRDADVGWGFGAAVADLDFRKKRRREFIGASASYTTKGQQNYVLIWNRWLNQINLENGGILQEERNVLTGQVGWSKTLTRRFYGIGPDTEKNEETRYTDKKAIVDLEVERSWPEPGSDFIWKLGMRGEFHQLSDGVGGGPNTEEVFPVLFNQAEDTNLGILNAAIGWDTRDSQVNPYRGWDIGADVEAALFQTDWDVGATWTLGGSYTLPVWGVFHAGGDPGEENPPTDVIAVRALIQQVSGDLPFYQLPSLGGSEYLRGFVGGRFRDDSLWVTGLEWRFWVIPRGFRIPFTEAVRIERVGLAPFFEAGTVADNVGDFGHAKVHLSYGVSLLVALERIAPFRVNFGWSSEAFNVSAGFGLDF